ncbi:hypothetical protein EV368DRAFT_69646 [Lentinula lateritia]|nr:hypothetical protein EV368DRAFT_69646 [Lentinula lateritia]
MHFFTVCLSLILGLSVIVQAAPFDVNTRGFELNVRSSTASNVSVPSGETNHPQDPRQGILVYVHFSRPIDIYHEGPLLLNPQMAEQIDFDPAKIPAPDFAGETYAFMQITLMADANTPEVTTNELAVQHLKDQWEAHIGGLRTQYQVQLQEAEALREQSRQEAVEAEKLTKADRLEKEKELTKETEKKHPLHNYISLWYFLPDTAAKARERSKESLGTNHLQFTVEEGDPLAVTWICTANYKNKTETE